MPNRKSPNPVLTPKPKGMYQESKPISLETSIDQHCGTTSPAAGVVLPRLDGLDVEGKAPHVDLVVQLLYKGSVLRELYGFKSTKRRFRIQTTLQFAFTRLVHWVHVAHQGEGSLQHFAWLLQLIGLAAGRTTHRHELQTQSSQSPTYACYADGHHQVSLRLARNVGHLAESWTYEKGCRLRLLSTLGF